MCKKQRFSFTQLERIRNHILGRKIEIRWFACSGIYGIRSSQFSTETRIRVIQARRDLCTNQREVCAVPHTLQKRKKSRGMFNVLDNVDLVPSNVQFGHQEALLYVFGDNEAVIKMIVKGRSPTMRHVSRTHRVALDWLFDRINLNHQNPNQIH